MNKYDDIIDIEYKGSIKRKKMPLSKRAGIFAPFSALTGYEESIKETGRITNNKKILSDETKEIINKKLNLINDHIKEKPKVNITYFQKDNKKEGGKYINKEIYIKKINILNKYILSITNEKINFDDIVKIND